MSKDKIWMGWLTRESGPAGFRQTNGDNGNAYGLMQFDRRYALVPFMQYCVDHSARYNAFKPYISYGVGSTNLKGSGALAVVWTFFCDTFPEEFKQLQIAYGYKYYYLEAVKYMKNLHGIVMDDHSPAVKGTLWSMAIRSGALCAARKFAGCTNDTDDKTMLAVSYFTYGEEDAKRWTKAGQWGDALKALDQGLYTDIKTEVESGEGMSYKITNAISSARVPAWGNARKYIAIHYLGVVGQNHDIQPGGYGAHYYIYWDGTIYQRCDHDAVLWQVGTGGYYTKKHAKANNYNTIGIELCCKCDGNAASAEDKKWYFTEETQKAAVWLVQRIMAEEGIPIQNVLRHYDIVNKTCPAPYVHNNKYKTSWTWTEFLAKVGGSEPEKAEPIKYYRIRKSWKDEASQIGAFKDLELAKGACLEGYTIYDWNGKAVYTIKQSSSKVSIYTRKKFIKQVQKAIGAAVDGIAGQETISKTVTVSAAKNRKHAVVKPIQKRLKALGYTEVGKADGVAGEKFTAAVIRFQKANGCTADGEITAKGETWRKLLGMK